MLDAEGRALTVDDVVAAGAAVGAPPAAQGATGAADRERPRRRPGAGRRRGARGQWRRQRASGGPRVPADRARRPPRARDDLPAPRARSHPRAPSASRSSTGRTSSDRGPCCERRGRADVPSVRATRDGRRPILRGVRLAAHTGRGRRRAPTGASSTTASSVASPIVAIMHRRNEDAMQVARIGERVLAVVCDGVSSSAAAADASRRRRGRRRRDAA